LAKRLTVAVHAFDNAIAVKEQSVTRTELQLVFVVFAFGNADRQSISGQERGPAAS